ncbi:MAG: copper chaperone PCu(A)C [Dehalococcoidia bacterium]|nr:copper chaperone PCu(A)C [Dehalococcoidia bacterium]
MTRFSHLRLLAAALAALGAMTAFAACGGDDDEDDGGEVTQPAATATKGAASPAAVAGNISIENPFARATTNDVSAIFMTIKNSGSTADRLVNAKVDSSVAGVVEVHETVTQGATSKMQKVAGIDIPANSSAELKSGGYHIMLMNVKREIKEGETLDVTVVFEKAGEVKVKAPVVAVGGMPGMNMGGGATPGSGGGMAMTTIAVKDAFARATTNDVAGVFMTITNSGAADRLIAAKIDSAIAGVVEVHETVTQGSTSKMQKVEGIDIPANGTAELKPGGYHVMLLNVKREIKAGETLELTLVFQKAGEIKVKANVVEMGASGGMAR